jgi:DNA-binding NarL/FixJ family response regulator
MSGNRLIVADDDALLREGIASILAAAGYEIVGQAADAGSLAELVRATVPDVAVIDIRMPPTHTREGLDAARMIREAYPGIGILLLSAHVEVDIALDLLEGGEGIGYLLKRRVMTAGDLVDAVERIAAGGSVIDPALVQELIVQRRRTDPLAELTAREREVLALMAEGRSNGGIAALLVVTEGAVEKHVRSILAKLQLPTSGEGHRRVLAVLTFLESV